MLARTRSQGKRRLAIATCGIAFDVSSWSLHTVYVYMALAYAVKKRTAAPCWSRDLCGEHQMEGEDASWSHSMQRGIVMIFGI